MFSRLDLKARIAIFTVALFICAIWVLAHDLQEEVRDNFQEVLSAQQFYTVEHIAGSLDEAIKLRLTALADAASILRPERMPDQGRLHAFLAAQAPLYRFFNTGIFIVSKSGIGLADLPTLPGREGSDFSDRDFYREVLATGKPFVGKPILGRFTDKPVIVMAVPIRNSRDEIIGILVGGNRIAGSDLVSEIVPKFSYMSGDVHVLSPKDGIFVTSTDASRILQAEPPAGANKMYDRYRQGYEGSGVALNSLGIENLSSAKRVTSTGWLVMATLPTAIAFKPIKALEWEIYQDALLSSALIALLLWLFLYYQLRPLSRSAGLLERMASGLAPLRPLHLEGSKEIRRLLGSFNKLEQHISDQNALLHERAEQMRLAASVFEGTSEAILICSPDNRILSVNRAFCNMTGYQEAELIGQNPRLLKSGQHDADFYREMWSSLVDTGQWHGDIWNRRKNGEIYPERLNVSALYDDQGQVLRYIAIAADVTEQKQAEEVIWRQANYDLLTDLPNRRLLQEKAQQALEKAGREGSSLALLHIDLDHFSEVNDTLGHVLGDQLLTEAGIRISLCAGAGTEVVAHLGGDEFVVILSTSAEAAARGEQMAADILRATAQAFHLGGETIYVSASIGITLFPGDAGDLTGLLANANQAKQVAKNQGRNRYCRFTASMLQSAQVHMQLANDMHGALAAGQFRVYYQPIVDLASGRMVKAEALLRWQHPQRGLVSPSEFIPIAEETGLINEIGDWVFKEAAQMARRWCHRCEFSDRGTCTRICDAAGGQVSCPQQISINKSPRQFFTGSTDKTWIAYLQQNQIHPATITIEITEGLLLDRHPEVMEKFLVFRDAGIQVALDDFGTGYSAMSYLKKFDIDYLKIDRSFVRDIVTDASDRAIAEAVIVMAHKLGLKVVAEGVETADQRDLLAAAGCDYGQGYLFARPMPEAEFERLIGTV